jgi:hypothetical protein
MAALLASSLKLSAAQPTCTSAPGAPTGLTATVSQGVVSLTWDAPVSCASTGYVVYAGSSPGATDVATVALANVRRFSVAAPAGTYYVFIVAQNDFGSSPPSAVVPVVVRTADPPAATTRAPMSITPGAWRVTRHVQPGRYYADPQAGCYWERQRGFSGALPDVIANEFIAFDAGQWIVDIFSTDAGFESDPACGTWSSTPRASLQSTIRPGVWLIGTQIPAGTYRVNAAAGCYWARLRNFTSQLDGIVDNDFSPLEGSQVVTLLPTDVGFESDADCGTWTRVDDESGTSRNPSPTSDELLLRWMLNQEQESARHPSARGRRAADAAPR